MSRIRCTRADFRRREGREARAIPTPSLMVRAILPLALAGLLGCWTTPEPQTGLFEWVDEAGVVHYTTDRENVPENYRSTTRLLSADRGTREAARAGAPARRARPETPPFVESAVPRADRSAPPPSVRSAPPATRRAPEISAQQARAIADKEAAIQQDREALKDFISQESSDGTELATDPQLRELAEHLARLESDLAALRAGAQP